jgi:hypothetical protein
MKARKRRTPIGQSADQPACSDMLAHSVLSGTKPGAGSQKNKAPPLSFAQPSVMPQNQADRAETRIVLEKRTWN